MSLNLSQVFVRYPDVKDAGEVLADFQRRTPQAPEFIAARAPGSWIAVFATDDAPPPAAAQALSRALEARAVWFGLAGSALAYRFRRYELGRLTEEAAEPAEIFQGEGPARLPEYRDAELVLAERLREQKVPGDYVYVMARELGMAGGEPDAARVRGGRVEPFSHRVPKRLAGGVRTLFDEFVEGEETVTERLDLKGAYDEARAEQLLRTLERITRRRSTPPGWTVRYAVASADPELPEKLAALHAKARRAFELR